MDKKEKILCVDDEVQIVISLRALLRSKYEVLIATSGEEALDILRKDNTIRVLISDQRMPKMLGAEVLREARKISPGTMRLLLTGYSDLQAIIDSINEGEVFRFINKPWNNQELRFIVELAVAVAIETGQAAESISEAGVVVETTVDFQLDRTQNEAGSAGAVQDAAVSHADLPAAGTLTSESILVVDDDRDVVSTLKELFGDTVLIYSAHSIHEAIEILGDKHVTVIISETVVAGEDATEFVKLLKQHHPDIITIMLTKFHSADTMISLINQGQIYRYSYKPIQKNQLGSYIKSAFVRHGANLKKPELLKRHQVEEIKDIQNPSLVGKLMGRLKSLRLRMGF